MKYFGIGLLALALVTVLASADGDAPVRLRYSWRRGDQLIARMRLTIRHDREVVQKREHQIGRLEVESVNRLDVINVRATGHAEIKVKVLYHVVRQYAGAKLVGYIDTRLLSQLGVLPELTRYFEHAEYSVVVNDRGRITQAHGVEELVERYRLIAEQLLKDPRQREIVEQLQQTAFSKDNLLESLSLFVPLPEEAIRPGQTWEDESTVRAEALDVGGSLRYRLAEPRAGAPMRISAEGRIALKNKEEDKEYENVMGEAKVQAALAAPNGFPLLGKMSGRLAFRTVEARGQQRTPTERVEIEFAEEMSVIPLAFQKPALTVEGAGPEGRSIAFLPNGQLVTEAWAQYRGKPKRPDSADAGRPETHAYELTVRIWDPTSGKLVQTYIPVRCVIPWPCSLDPTGRRLVWPARPKRDQGIVRRLDVDTGELWEVDIETGKKSQRVLAGPAVNPSRRRSSSPLPNLEVVQVLNWRWPTRASGTGPHEAALGEIRQLRSLSFTSWKKVDDVLARLPEMAQVRELDLSDTDVSDEGLQQLSKFPRLEKLRLENQYLAGTRPTAKGLKRLAVLKNLRELYLAGCVKPDEEVQEILAGLKGLRVLDLGAWATTPTIKKLDRLKTLTQLRELRLGGNLVTTEALEDLGRFPELRTLHLSCRGPDGPVLVRALSRLKHIRELNLDCGGLKDADLVDLMALKQLQKLSLSHISMNQTLVHALTELRDLRELRLDYGDEGSNNGAGTGLNGLNKLKSLRKLTLDGHPNVGLIAGLKDLRGVEIELTSVHDAVTLEALVQNEIADLRAAQAAFELVPADRQAVQAAEAAVCRHVANLRLAQATLDLGRRELKRSEALAPAHATSRKEPDEHHQAVQVAEAAVDEQVADLGVAEVILMLARANLSRDEELTPARAFSKQELDLQRAAVQVVEEAVSRHVANRPAAQASLARAQANFKRSMDKPAGAISPEEYDQLRQAVPAAQAALDQQVANLRLGQAILRLAGTNLAQNGKLAPARDISKKALDQRRQAVQVMEEAVNRHIANRRAAEANYHSARTDYERGTKLVREGGISAFECDMLMQAIHAATAALDQQAANVRVTQVILDLARADLKKGEDFAPARRIGKVEREQRGKAVQDAETAVRQQQLADDAAAQASLELAQANLRWDERLARTGGERNPSQQAVRMAVATVDQQVVNLRVAQVALALAEVDLKRGEQSAIARRISKEELDHLRQALQEAEAAVQQDIANRRGAEAALERTRVDLKRGEQLAPRGLISKQDLDRRRKAVRFAEAAVKRQGASPGVSQMSLALARADLKRGAQSAPGRPISKEELDEFRKTVKDAKAAVKQAVTNRRAAQATLELARVSLAQADKSVDARAMSSEALDRRREAVQAAEATFDQQDANLRVAQVTFALARAYLKRHGEPAPAGGISREELDQRRQAVQFIEEAVSVHHQVVNRLAAQVRLELARPDLERAGKSVSDGGNVKTELDRCRQALQAAVVASYQQVANRSVGQVTRALAHANLKRAELFAAAGSMTKEELDKLRQAVRVAATPVNPAPPGSFQTYALSLNHLTDQHLEHLVKLRGVRKLALGAQISADQLQRLSQLKDLEILDLSSSQLTDKGLQVLSSFPGLRVLNLSRSKLTGVGLQDLAVLKNLRELDLSANPLMLENLGHLAEIAQLEKLNLSRVELGDTQLKHLAGLKRLRVLDLSDTEVSPVGVNEFLERGFVEGFPKTTGPLEVVRLHVAPAGKRILADLRPDDAAAELVFRDLEKGKTIRLPKAEWQTGDSLSRIALAMHKFASDHDHFPPAAIYDKDGKSLLSWRVQMLPFVGQEALYKEFHLDEPWDSKHNKALLLKMPKIYARPDGKGKPDETHYVGFVGKGAFFEDKKGLGYLTPSAFPNGTSDTLMIVEASKAVPWTKPEDLPFDPAKPLPRVGTCSAGPDAFRGVMCDGSVHRFSNKMKPETLKALITRDWPITRGWSKAIDEADAFAPDNEVVFYGHAVQPMSSLESMVVALSPDGLRLVDAGSIFTEGVARELIKLGKKGAVKRLFLEADKIMSACLVVRDLTSGRILYTRTQQDLSPIVETAFSPDGTVLASGSVDGKLALWDLEKGQVLRVIQGYGATPIVFSPDGKKVAAGHANGWISVWDTATGKELNTIFSTGPVAFSPDGKTLATAGPPYAGWGIAHPVALLADRNRHPDLSGRQDYEEPAPPTADERRNMPKGTPISLWRLEDRETKAFNTHLLDDDIGEGRPDRDPVNAQHFSPTVSVGWPMTSSARWLLFGGLVVIGTLGALLLLLVRRKRSTKS